jgi:DNA-binding NarL/FixJ family response regulator
VERPTVLLGNLEPILVLGLRRVLADDGIEIVGQEEEHSRLVLAARRLRPDTVVLDLHDERARLLAQQIRIASPATKVVLWSRDETVMEVLDPGSELERVVAIQSPAGLSSELSSIRNRVEE